MTWTEQRIAIYAVLAVATVFFVVLAPVGVTIQRPGSGGNSSPIVDAGFPGGTTSPSPAAQTRVLRVDDGTAIYHPDDPGPTVASEVDRSFAHPSYEELAYHENGSVRNETVQRRGVVVERRTFNSTAIERALAAEIREVRRAHDREAWHWSPVLDSAARKHAADMATHGFVAHQGTGGSTPDDRLDAAWAGNDCTVGENVAEVIAGSPFRDPNGTVHDESSPLYVASNEAAAESFVRQWLDSPDHRELLLHPSGEYAGVGVSLRRGDRGEAVYVYGALTICFR